MITSFEWAVRKTTLDVGRGRANVKTNRQRQSFLKGRRGNVLPDLSLPKEPIARKKKEETGNRKTKKKTYQRS